MLVKKLFAFLFVCFMGFSCSDKKEKETETIPEFSGTYIFSQAPLKDTLFLEVDSTYRHKFSSANGEVYEAVGKWRYDPKLEEILFKKFVFYNDSGPATPPGNWFSRVRFSSKGDIDLMYSQDNNIFYRKISYGEKGK